MCKLKKNGGGDLNSRKKRPRLIKYEKLSANTTNMAEEI